MNNLTSSICTNSVCSLVLQCGQDDACAQDMQVHGQHVAMLHSRTCAKTVIHAVRHKHAVYNDIVDSLLHCDN